MKYLFALLMLVASPAFAQQSIQGTPNGFPVNIGAVNSSGAPNLFNCDKSVVYDTNTNGKTQLVAAVSGQKTYVCGISLSTSQTTAVSVSLGSGTGTNCGSTYTAKTPAWPLQAPTSVGPSGLVLPVSLVPWFTTASGEELCISTSAGQSVQLLVTYTQL